jgi:hypothetical protein
MIIADRLREMREEKKLKERWSGVFLVLEQTPWTGLLEINPAKRRGNSHEPYCDY